MRDLSSSSLSSLHSEPAGAKVALFIRNTTCTAVLSKFISEFNLFKKPNSLVIKADQTLFPFEDRTKLENLLCSKGATLFGIVSDSKKRPSCFTIGRMYKREILDMLELLIDPVSIKSLSATWNMNTKPFLIFQGTKWESEDEVYQKLKNLFIDFWADAEGEKVLLSLTGDQHALVFSADDHKPSILCSLLFLERKSPQVNDAGFSFQFTIGRKYFATDQVQEEAISSISHKRPKEKNVEFDSSGDKFGRIHVPRQDFSLLQTRKVKALKGSNKH